MKGFKRIAPTMDTLCQDAAQELLRLMHQTIDERRVFHLFLAGGSTPQRFYNLLATPIYAKAIPWGNVHLYFGDERHVAPDHSDSNFKMVNDSLLKKINIDPTHIHRIQGELDAADAADAYHQAINSLLPKDADNRPQADLILLGLGPDGHTASLFPDTDILDNTKAYCAAVWVSKFNTWRISITYPVINNARNLWFLVAGDNKQPIVNRIFNHPSTIDPLPVERISARGAVTWFMDQSAANPPNKL